MSKLDLTPEQGWEVIVVLREYQKEHPEDPVYDGEFPTADEPGKVKELAEQYVAFAISMQSDGAKDPLVAKLLRAGGQEIEYTEEQVKVIEELEAQELPGTPVALQDDAEEVAKAEEPSGDVAVEVSGDKYEPEEESPAELVDRILDEVDKESWLAGLNQVAQEWNLPVPEALEEEEVPKVPRDLTKLSVQQAHVLSGKVNAALGIAIWLNGQARTDIKQVKFLKQRKYAELFRELTQAGKNKTAAKEAIEHEESYILLEEKLAKAESERDYWQTYVDIYSNHKDLLSRSLSYRQLEQGN